MTSINPTLSSQLDRSWADRLIPQLNGLLADFEMLRFNIRSAMWNGWGEQYPVMLDMLPEYMSHAEGSINMIGHRIRCLEGRPISTMAEAIESATLAANDGTLHHRACAKMLRESLSHVLKTERELIATAQHAGDEVTAMKVAGLMQFQEEALWKLRTTLRRTAFEEKYLSRESA